MIDIDPGLFVLMSYSMPVAGVRGARHWIELNEPVDGMRIGTLKAFGYPLDVADDIVEVFVASIDSSEERWRKNLTWHSTSLDGPTDPTVMAYVQALHGIGLTWTPSTGMASERYGWRLAQAAYPMDLSEENFARLGLEIDLMEVLGEKPDSRLHALIFLTENDD